MASTRKSDNAFYRSADLKRPFDNIKEAMGLTGNADSNYYTNLGKVSRYEGSEMDNRKKQGLWDALQLAIQGKTPDQALMRHSGHGASDIQKGLSGEALLPDLIRKGGFLADQEGAEVDTLNKIA